MIIESIFARFGDKNMLRVTLTVVFVLAIAMISERNAYASEITVVDGDTIRIGDVSYRIHGIDAPEASQKCTASEKKQWLCGVEAMKELFSIVHSESLRCDPMETDGYGRVIAVCWIGDTDVGKTMVRRGYAWAFRKFSSDYVRDEEQAKMERLGIWRAETEAAWVYRERRWSVHAQKSPNGCPIKGNISKSGRIYHAPWSPWYTRTKINRSKGERWFCSEREALDAGWRAPHWGRSSSQ